ncbi:MAG: CocE/NonD family hydrolase [Phocaeicola sp.]
MKQTKLTSLLWMLLSLFATPAKADKSKDSLIHHLDQHYTKREVMIPMRDGVKLYTAIYEPKSKAQKHPILMQRTPYSCAPYGEGYDRSITRNLWNYVKDEYIFVFQDVRGRYQSEGQFVQVRPLNKNRNKKKKEIDEATDTYDTVEWLTKNSHNNGNAGVWGISYDGFYATMAASSGHPALKAVSPQAPVTDWYRGDDRHHNGAFTLLQTTNFLPRLEGRNIGVGVIKDIVKNDVYTDFLAVGTFKDIDNLVQDTTETMWNNIKNHPDFDSFWQERDARTSCYNLKPAMLVVGGHFDSEDCYGPWGLYRAIQEQSPTTELYLTFGPWWHGAWTSRNFQSIGNIYFGESSSAYYLDHIEYPFFSYYLNNSGEKPVNKVNIFDSGDMKWRTYDKWPATTLSPTPYYIHANGSVSTQAPTQEHSFTEYVSDMSRPVPYTALPTTYRTREFMVDDQRFATARPDVITFVTEPLKDTLRLGGPIEVELKAAISGTDADFMVKVIDVFPENFSYPKEVKEELKSNYPMSGYQLMVRGELFRGRYREAFDAPKAFVPGEITPVNYTLYDVAHTFLPGHRLMIQIQSSWFPIIDRNPQRFINTYECTVVDFLMQQNIQIYHQADAATRLLLPVIE